MKKRIPKQADLNFMHRMIALSGKHDYGSWDLTGSWDWTDWITGYIACKDAEEAETFLYGYLYGYALNHRALGMRMVTDMHLRERAAYRSKPDDKPILDRIYLRLLGGPCVDPIKPFLKQTMEKVRDELLNS